MNELEIIQQELQSPTVFNIADFSDSLKDEIVGEVMEKVKASEGKMKGFYGEYNEYADSWRVKKTSNISTKPQSLHNSRVGETHRATEALATFWYRIMTSNDRFFEAIARGYDWNGKEITETDLYAVENVLEEQNNVASYRRKLLNSCRSGALFGTVIVEEPWVQRPVVGKKYIEYTDFVPRSLLTTFFDPFVWDIELSSFLATADYHSKWSLQDLAQNDKESWDVDGVNKYIKESHSNSGQKTEALARVSARRQRAGYQHDDQSVYELLSYHGRINPDNKIVQAWCEFNKVEEDPRFLDFTVRILNGEKIVSFDVTQYGDWRTRFKVGRFKEFELEPLAYGVGSLGNKQQRSMDLNQSKMEDVLLMSLFNMWKVSKYAGLKTSQLGIKPLNIIELEDISQLEPLRPDLNGMGFGKQLMDVLKEDFRSIVGSSPAQSADSATESGIMQNESDRSRSVHAEIIADPLIRQHLEQCHINNLNNLDSDIWVEMTGEKKPEYRPFNRMNLPINVGFKLKITSDRDFGPQRLQNIMEALKTSTSIRNVIPEAINVIRPLYEEWFRGMRMNPRLLNKPTPIADQLSMQMQRQKIAGNPALTQEVQGEQADSAQGGGDSPEQMMQMPPAQSVGGVQ